jgi:hypothetical protein
VAIISSLHDEGTIFGFRHRRAKARKLKKTRLLAVTSTVNGDVKTLHRHDTLIGYAPLSGN